MADVNDKLLDGPEVMQMDRSQNQGGKEGFGLIQGESSRAYEALMAADLLVLKHRRESIEAIFTGVDITKNTVSTCSLTLLPRISILLTRTLLCPLQDHYQNIKLKCKMGHYCCCPFYNIFRRDFFVPAGHVGLLMNERNDYYFAQPGMHNVSGMFTRLEKIEKLRGHIEHGNRTIVIVEQGYVGYAMDNGQPVLLPPGIHVWTSESLYFERSYQLSDHIIKLGPYTILTVDEGYAAVTQNNGKMSILEGGKTHILNHKNWKFEKFMTLKIQTDDLEKIKATSADNIEMEVTSTMNWKITDVITAATNAAETMASSGIAGDVSADITKLRMDVRKQAIASLAGFIGGVNYSETFHMSADNQRKNAMSSAPAVPPLASVDGIDQAEAKVDYSVPSATAIDNPMFDAKKMYSAVEHANAVTRTYGVEVLSINIISASPIDASLTRALASGAVASAEALQAETTARGNARAATIVAENDATCSKINASGKANADVILADGTATAETKRAEGAKNAADLLSQNDVAVELTKMDRSARMLRGGEKYFFGESPEMLSNIILKGAV